MTSTLGRVLAILEATGTPYMLTGSFASSLYGRPRATQDLDFVVNVDPMTIRELVTRFRSAGFYVSDDAVRDALVFESQFNVIDIATGWKVDFILRKSRPFSFEEFSRRRSIEHEGWTLHVATAEDILIAKLEWAHRANSARQLEDAAGVLEMQGETLDLPYLERWIRDLGLEEEWASLRSLSDD